MRSFVCTFQHSSAGTIEEELTDFTAEEAALQFLQRNFHNGMNNVVYVACGSVTWIFKAHYTMHNKHAVTLMEVHK